MPAEQKEMKGEVAAPLKAKGSGSGAVGGGSPQLPPPCPLCAPPAPLPNTTTAAATEPRHFLVSVLLFWVSSSLGKRSAGLQELELHGILLTPVSGPGMASREDGPQLSSSSKSHSLGAPSPLRGTQASSPHTSRVFLGENGIPGVSGSQISKTMAKEPAPNQKA